jgi:hypothetical protein
MVRIYRKRSTGAMLLVSLLTALALVACGGAELPEPEAVAANTPTAVQQEEVTPTSEAPATVEDEATESAATTVEAETADTPAPTPSDPAVCEAIDIPDNDSLPAIANTDWTKGPDDAPITLVEYGDFQ